MSGGLGPLLEQKQGVFVFLALSSGAHFPPTDAEARSNKPCSSWGKGVESGLTEPKKPPP